MYELRNQSFFALAGMLGRLVKMKWGEAL